MCEVVNTFSTPTLYFTRSCIENLSGAVHVSKGAISLHHYMIGSVGEQILNDKIGIIQWN